MRLRNWVIPAVVDCEAVAQEADVAVGLAAYTAGAPLNYTIVVNNAGPAAASSMTVVDIFPAPFTGATWTCSGSNGGTCVANGSGNTTQLVSLPAGGEVAFDVNGIGAGGRHRDPGQQRHRPRAGEQHRHAQDQPRHRHHLRQRLRSPTGVIHRARTRKDDP